MGASTEASATAAPAWSNAYDWAVVRLITHFAAGSKAPRLLFGTVSLLSKDRPRPTSVTGLETCKLRSGRDGKLFFRRTALSAIDAINWYRSDAETRFVTPVPSLAGEVDPKLDGVPLALTELADDPHWPSLGLPVAADWDLGGPGNPAPFIGSGSAPARIHRRFGSADKFESVLQDANAIEFVKRRLHIDVLAYREYLGSLTLIAPDPIIKTIRNFIAEDKTGRGEDLVFRFVPRPGQTLAGLQLTVIEKRANLLSRFETTPIPSDGLVVLRSQLPIQASGYVVTHPTHGVIADQPPLPFIRTINMNVGVASRRVKVKAPMSETHKSADASYEVVESSHEVLSTHGLAAPMTTVARVFESEARRSRQAFARSLGQTWFEDGQREAALSFIRTRIGRGRTQVIIADPYFGANQIMQFVHAIRDIKVDIFVLTSRLAFEASADGDDSELTQQETGTSDTSASSSDVPPAHSKESKILRRLHEFQDALETLERRGVPNARVGVLAGRNPPLHDRFLAVDDDVWFLGNSLNALGDRASLILKVPDSEPVLARLHAMIGTSVSFEDYKSSRLHRQDGMRT